MLGTFRGPGWAGPLFELTFVEQGRALLFPPLSHQWWPSHAGMEGRADGVRLIERKFVTQEDEAVDLVQLTNEDREPRTLTVRVIDRCGAQHTLAAPGFESLERGFPLRPGESVLFPIALSFDAAPRVGAVVEILDRHLVEYNGWFETHIPDFDCSDPWFAKLWYYRWYVVRRTLDEPEPEDPILRWLRYSERRWLRGLSIPSPPRPALPEISDIDRFYDAPFPVRTGAESRLSVNAVWIESMAEAIRRRRDPRVTRLRFFDFLQRYVRSQYAGGDFARPSVGEVLDSDTGAWKSPERDVLLSSYADLLIRHVGGLTPRDDETLEFFPIVDALARFRFRNVPYRGALLDIAWNAPHGFTVARDGRVLFTFDALRHVEWSERGGLKILE